jgi:hypothetical protein
MYTILDTKNTNELFLVRKGWLSPQYELTDNAFSYGQISYEGLSRHKATARTENNVWKIRSENAFKRSTTVMDEDGVLIGQTTQEWLSRKVTLTLQTGFTAEFSRPSIWSGNYSWKSEGYGEIMCINNSFFSLMDTIHLNKSRTPLTIIPLLIFLGSHLIILSRQRKAVS